jgi:hypothetical protein
MLDFVTVSAAPAATHAPCGGRVGNNGTITHRVPVRSRDDKVRMLTFTRHSPDRYTVSGLSTLSRESVSLERRQPNEHEVLLEATSAMYTLADTDQWIAHSFVSGSYYGVLAVGATAEQAYQNLFHRFSRFG